MSVRAMRHTDEQMDDGRGGSHQSSRPSSARSPSSVRSEEPTIPSNRGVVASSLRASRTPTEGRASSPRLGLDSGEELALPLISPEWCVDLGAALQTMSTFELWTALATGRVTHETRVWREGMECWTAAAELADLACAVPDVDELEAECTRLVRDLGPETLASLDPEPLHEAYTPAPDSRQDARPMVLDAEPARRASSGLTSWARAVRRPAALGATFGAAAIVAALLLPAPRAAAAASERAAVGVAAASVAAAREATAAASSRPAPAPVVAAEPRPRPEHDRGQRRRRR